MKKVMLLLIIAFSVFINAKAITAKEKQEIIKQFAEFQTAVKNKDIAKVSSMVQFPMNEEAVYAFIEDGGSDIRITKKFFSENSGLVFEKLDFMTKIKAAPDSGDIKGYQDELPDEIKKRKYYYDNEESSYYYKDKSNKKIYGAFCSTGAEVYFWENYLIVSDTMFPSKLTPGASEDCDYSVIYHFGLVNGKLKLVKILAAG